MTNPRRLFFVVANNQLSLISINHEEPQNETKQRETQRRLRSNFIGDDAARGGEADPRRGVPSSGRRRQAAPARRGYHERVVDHYNNPRNVGTFDKDDPVVGTGLVGAPACGDVMKLQIRVDEGSGRIVDACFKTFGCGSAIASSSVASEWVKGKQMEEVVAIKNTEIAKHLSLPPVKLHCSMLAEDAIKAAVKDYEAKKAKLEKADE